MKDKLIWVANHGKAVFALYFGSLAITALGFSFLVGTDEVDSIYAATTTLTTVGFGDITPKTDAAKLFVSGAEVLGVFLHAIVLTYVVGVVNKDKWTHGEQEKHDDKLDMLLKAHGLEVPDDAKYES